MRMYLEDSVLEMARKRIRWVLNEFENVVINVSGGKDSTVIYHLTREIADDMGHDPPWVFWIDQEAEWQSTVDLVYDWMEADDVRPLLAQVPMKITNATSDTEDFLHCWNPEDEHLWMHERHPQAITENTYGTELFDGLFEAIVQEEVPQPTAQIAGVRTEESRTRYMGLTMYSAYKGATWGSHDAEDVFRFYPIYDWSYSDVWKFIHDNDIPYNEIYDVQYQHGVPVLNMRVSNLHHETAVSSLFRLQEFEPDTYDKLLKRIGGIHTAAQFGEDDYFPDEVPFMFSGWREYRNYLLETLVDDPKHKKGFLKHFFAQDMLAEGTDKYDSILMAHVRGILANDWEGDSIINNARRECGFKENQRQRDRKIKYLKEQEPDTWQQLKAEGVV